MDAHFRMLYRPLFPGSTVWYIPKSERITKQRPLLLPSLSSSCVALRIRAILAGCHPDLF